MIYVTQDQMSTSARPRLAGHSPTNRQNIRLRTNAIIWMANRRKSCRGQNSTRQPIDGSDAAGRARKKVEAQNERELPDLRNNFRKSSDRDCRYEMATGGFCQRR